MKMRSFFFQLLILSTFQVQAVELQADCLTEGSLEIKNEAFSTLKDISDATIEKKISSFTSISEIEKEGFVFSASDDDGSTEASLEVDGSIAVLTIKSPERGVLRQSFNQSSLSVNEKTFSTGCSHGPKIFKYDGKLMINIACGVLASLEIGKKYVSIYDVDGKSMTNENPAGAIVLIKK